MAKVAIKKVTSILKTHSQNAVNNFVITNIYFTFETVELAKPLNNAQIGESFFVNMEKRSYTKPSKEALLKQSLSKIKHQNISIKKKRHGQRRHQETLNMR